MPYLSSHEHGVIIQIHVQPRASRNRIHGPHGNSLKVSITAPPLDNRANSAVISYLAGLFSLPKSSVLLLSGGQSRCKRLLLPGYTIEGARAVLEPMLSGSG